MSESDTSGECYSPDIQKCQEATTRCGNELEHCFQCLKCAAGCPMSEHMDLGPARVIRLLQLGQLERVLRSNTIWLCAGCLTCSTRCPNTIDIAHIMDALRQEAMRRGIEGPSKKIAGFHNGFLKSVRRHGRSFETGLLAGYALKNGELMKNMGLGMTMFFKGKMPMLPKNVANRKAIRKMFERLLAKKD